jgi:peptidoglycan-N-acetylglucosamine deacetylase
VLFSLELESATKEVMETRRCKASLSLDLDDKWSYMKIHGERKWRSFPSYLDVVVPRVLQFLKMRNLTATFFIVGQDAVAEKNHDLLRSIASAGHEIGNHSFHHEPWMHLYSQEQIETEIGVAEEHIERATGQKPTGFRGPGYSLSYPVLRALIRKGYQYDATTFPSLIDPLVRAYYYSTANLSPEQRRKRKLIGGTLRDGLRPIRQYRWQLDNGALIEIPVTTMPIFKLPIHVSYLMGLNLLTHSLALQYFNAALKLCRWTGTQPSLVLHPTDFLGCDDTKELSFIPGMNLPSERKLELVSELLRRLSAEFRVVTLQEHAQEAADKSDLRTVEPYFSNAKSPSDTSHAATGLEPKER